MDFQPTLRERRCCTALPVLQSATVRSILPCICPWRQNNRMMWISSVQTLPAHCWRKEEIACKEACWTRGYVNTAFVTHTQFRPSRQWPNILQSGVSLYEVPTAVWRRIHLTTKRSNDVGAMHFLTVRNFPRNWGTTVGERRQLHTPFQTFHLLRRTSPYTFAEPVPILLPWYKRKT